MNGNVITSLDFLKSLTGKYLVFKLTKGEEMETVWVGSIILERSRGRNERN